MHKKIYLSTGFKVLIIIIMLCIFCLSPAAYYYDNYTRARFVLEDAKNIQLAMRLLSIQYYGQDRNIYQPGEPYGMTEDTLHEIEYFSGANGEITLVCWNYDKSLPGKFFYQTDSFLVVYEYDTKRDEPEWSIYRLKKVMALGEG